MLSVRYPWTLWGLGNVSFVAVYFLKKSKMDVPLILISAGRASNLIDEPGSQPFAADGRRLCLALRAQLVALWSTTP